MTKIYKYSELGTPTLDFLTQNAYAQYNKKYTGPKLDITFEEACEFCDKYISPSSMPMLPDELLDNEQFMRRMILSKYPITFRSVVYYASDRLKNSKEFMSFAIQEHKHRAAKYIGSELAKDKQWILSEMSKSRNEANNDKNWDSDKLYIAKNLFLQSDSKLLEDEDYILTSLTYLTGSEIITMPEISPKLLSKKSFILKAIDVNPIFYNVLIEQNSEYCNDYDVIYAFVKSIADKRLFSTLNLTISKVNKLTKDKRLSKIFKYFEKIGELPSNAKTRKTIYSKIVNNLINKNYDAASTDEQTL